MDGAGDIFASSSRRMAAIDPLSPSSRSFFTAVIIDDFDRSEMFEIVEVVELLSKLSFYFPSTALVPSVEIESFSLPNNFLSGCFP